MKLEYSFKYPYKDNFIKTNQDFIIEEDEYKEIFLNILPIDGIHNLTYNVKDSIKSFDGIITLFINIFEQKKSKDIIYYNINIKFLKEYMKNKGWFRDIINIHIPNNNKLGNKLEFIIEFTNHQLKVVIERIK